MDECMNTYMSFSLTCEVYRYISWNKLRQYNVSDQVWKYICDEFCRDDTFKSQFRQYWGSENLVSERDKFFGFINLLAKASTRHAHPKILLQNRDFVILTIQYLAKHQSCEDIFVWDSIIQHTKGLWQSDPTFILETISYSSQSLRDADISLRSDKDFMLKAVKLNGRALKFAGDNLKGDRKIVLEALNTYENAFYFASDKLKSDSEFVLRVIQRRGADILSACHPDLKKNYKFMLRATKLNKECIQYAHDSLKSNAKFMLEIIKLNTDAIAYINDSLMSNQNFVSTASKILNIQPV